MARNLLNHWGQWLIRHRLLVILIWVFLLGLGIFFSPQVEKVMQGTVQLTGSDSETVSQILQKEFSNRFNNELVIVFTSKNKLATDYEFQSAVESIQLKLRNLPQINNIVTYYDSSSPDLISKDQHSIIGVVELDVPDSFAAQNATPMIRKAIKDSHFPSWLNVYSAGEGAINYDLIDATASDAIKAESYSFPLIILILIFTFGALLAAGVPVILGTVSVVIALGLVFFIGQFTPVFLLAKNAVSMIGLGVGIDYSLIMVSRFREELQNGLSPKEAAVAIMSTSGKTVLFSGLLVVTGISAIFIIGIPFINSLAIAIIAVVIIAILAALTLLPTLFSWFGKRVNWPDSLSKLINKSKGNDFWKRIALGIMQKPLRYFIAAMLILLGLSFPLLHLKAYTPFITGLPKGAESTLAFEKLQQDFVAGKLSPVNIIIEAPPGESIWSEDSISKIYQFSRLIRKNKQTASIEGIVDIDPQLTLKDYHELYQDRLSGSENFFSQMVGSYTENTGKGHKTIMRVTSVEEPGSFASRALIKEIRTQLVPEVFGEAGFRVLVGGGSAREVDMDQIFLGKLPLIIGLVCTITFLILGVLFRSILIPLKSIFMNLLSVTASFGSLVLIFQDGLLRNLPGFVTPGGISSVILMFLFALLFGLSMDYEIFLTLRIKEEHDRGINNKESVARGLERTAGTVTSAALIMVIVFGSFILASSILTQEIGLGLAVAVFLDATIIRIILMPATMQLLGEWNWWFPKSLAKFLPKFNIKE
jgi:RND superfamily putative drug exporter